MQKKIQLYLWHGDNDFDMRVHLHKWLKVFTDKHSHLNIATIDEGDIREPSDTIEHLRQVIQGGSLFGSTKLIIFKNMLSNGSRVQSLLPVIKTLITALPPHTFVIFYQSEPIKHTDIKQTIDYLVKQKKGLIKQFLMPTHAGLLPWAKQYCKKKNVTIDTKTINYLLDKITTSSSMWAKREQPNLWLLSSELDKLTSYIYPDTDIKQEHVDKLVSGFNEFYIWHLINAILDGDKAKAAKILERRLLELPHKSYESELRILFNLLAGHIKKLLLVKQVTGARALTDIAENFRWSKHHLRMLQAQSQNTNRQELLTWQEKLIGLYKIGLTEPNTLKVRLLTSLVF